MTQQAISRPLAPQLPGGLVTPAQLRQLADIAEKYAGTIKIAGNSIVILGLTPQSHAAALTELGLDNQSFVAKTIRSIALCAGKPYCPHAMQDSTALGLALENAFYGIELPGKMRIGISGCPNACSEVYVKDIGIYGSAAGYTIVVGGNSGRQAQAGHIAAEKIPPADVQPLVGRIIAYYQAYAQPGERLGQTLKRRGFEDFSQAIR